MDWLGALMATKTDVLARVSRLEDAIRRLIGNSTQPGEQARALKVLEEEW